MYITIGSILGCIFFLCMLLIPIFIEFEDYEFLEDFHDYKNGIETSRYATPFLGLTMHIAVTIGLSLLTIIAYPLTIITGAIVLYAVLKRKSNNN